MSHELRTPLNAILGFSDLLNQDTNITPQQHSHLHIINRSGEHLLTVINNVLDFSKIDAARVTVNAAPFNVHRLLNDLIPMFSLRATQKGLRLTAVLDPSLPDTIMADQGKLRQILINLLGNAVKFTAAGEIRLSVYPAAEQIVLRFVVEDTGVGIAAEDLERIFEPFMQTQLPNQLQEGTGLGLAISREFARLMGGDLRVTSVVGQGSAFTLDLPLLLPDEDEGALEELTAAQIVGLVDNQPVYRLLIADDAPTTRQLLLELLQPLGFAVRVAENGRHAVDVWREWQPHLILMDANMPEVDGLTAARQIRSEAEEESAPVIVAMTANVSLADQEAARQAGCDDFLAKPFPLPAVLTLLAERLGVVYRYRSDPARLATAAAPPDAAAVAHYLAALPPARLADIAAAAQAGDVNWLNRLLHELPEEDTAVAQYLTDLAHKFDHERLHRLTADAANPR